MSTTTIAQLPVLVLLGGGEELVANSPTGVMSGVTTAVLRSWLQNSGMQLDTTTAGVTQAPGTNTTQLATTAFVTAGIAVAAAAVPLHGFLVVPAAGAGSWTPPAGVTSVVVEIAGGSGGGNGVGFPGGAGGWAKAVVVTTPGTPVAYTVGAGGLVASAGGNTTFGAVAALGGTGSTVGAAPQPCTVFGVSTLGGAAVSGAPGGGTNLGSAGYLTLTW